MEQEPFDIGRSTHNALSAIKWKKASSSQPRLAAKELNQASVSNGSLMKITPLIVWGQLLSNADFEKIIPLEVKAIHP